MNTIFRHGHIEANSSSTTKIDELKIGSLDILIVSASWDSRSSWMSEINDLSAKLGIIITYDNTDPAGRQEKNKQALLSYLQTKCAKVEEVNGCAREIESLWSKLQSKIHKHALQSSSPLRICFDITAAPRYCSLAALSSCLNAGIADAMTFLYADGAYEESGAPKNDYVFHEGEWRSVPVESLEQMYDPAKRKLIIVSVGFEGTRTMRVINEQEPDRIAVLFPDPGVCSGYVKITEDENRGLLSDYLVPEDKIIRADAGDAVQAWMSLHTAGLEHPDSENTFYLCCGTKPHAFALGLRAMSTRLGTVLYYVPDNHKVTDVKAAGRYWRYDIRDTSAFPR